MGNLEDPGPRFRQAPLRATVDQSRPFLQRGLPYASAGEGSEPPGTPPDKMLAAVRDFSREAFALKHRDVIVLHTTRLRIASPAHR